MLNRRRVTSRLEHEPCISARRMLYSNTYLGQVVAQLDAWLAINRSKLDDDIQSLALLLPSAGKRLEIIGEKGANAKRSYESISLSGAQKMWIRQTIQSKFVS